jgi:hypothetical protein
MGNIFAENPTWSLGIIFVLFGILAVHRLTVSRNKESKVIQAVADFKDSFSEIIHDLRTPFDGVVFQLDGIQERHWLAKTQLELSLSRKGVKRLNKVWGQYKNMTQKYYAKISGHDQDPSSQWRIEFISEINSMLQKVSKIT